MPVPPRTLAVWRILILTAQAFGVTDAVNELAVLTRRILRRGTTRSCRFTVPGSPGRLATLTIRPAPVKAPLATIRALTTVRAPDSSEVTMTPRSDSLPVARVAAVAADDPIASSVWRLKGSRMGHLFRPR
jgi:hypothetical protein